MRYSICFCTIVLILLTGIAEAQWTWTPQTGRFINLKRMPKETPELQLEYARSLMLSGDYRKALRETDKFIEYYGNDAMADENQFLRGEILLAQGKYTEASSAFQQLIAAYPDSDKYEEAVENQYDIGDRYYQRGEQLSGKKWHLFRNRPYKRAADVYTMVVDNQPFTPAAAEAQYKIGLCHYARKQYIDAAFEYQRVVEDYADSDWVSEASYGLAMCYYQAALSPAYDQTPSELAVNAIDDFAARYPEDERTQALQDKRAEMRDSIALQRLETARFYERRREFPAAKLYYELLAEEFPETEAGALAADWLENNAEVIHAGDKYESDIQTAP